MPRCQNPQVLVMPQNMLIFSRRSRILRGVTSDGLKSCHCCSQGHRGVAARETMLTRRSIAAPDVWRLFRGEMWRAATRLCKRCCTTSPSSRSRHSKIYSIVQLFDIAPYWQSSSSSWIVTRNSKPGMPSCQAKPRTVGSDAEEDVDLTSTYAEKMPLT